MSISDIPENQTQRIARREHGLAAAKEVKVTGGRPQGGFDVSAIILHPKAVGLVSQDALRYAKEAQQTPDQDALGPTHVIDDPDGTNEQQNEAFAKLKVALMNIDNSSGAPEGAESAYTSTADGGDEVGDKRGLSAAEKLKYLLLPARERIHAEVLDEMGITENQYESMPFEDRVKIDKVVADRLQLDNKALATQHDDSQQTLLSALPRQNLGTESSVAKDL